FVDLKAQYIKIKDEIDEAIKKVITDTAFINGKYVKEFETNFAQFCQTDYCVGVGNGTDAIFIVLKALGIGTGDEVIVPANTFVATSEAVTMSGAKVVFVDCDPESYNMDVNSIESHISSKTRAIIPVHLYGQPADMEAIRHIADKHGLKIVQDSAQAHGATIDGKPLSDYGDVLCYSFYPGKNLGAYGDAGMIVTNDKELAARARMLANHGRIGKYDHEFEGVNSRMDGIQGAVLNVKLKHLPGWTEKRRKVASLYDDFLKDIGDVIIPYCPSDIMHVYHLYVVRTRKRDDLRKYLADCGIATGIHYPIALPNLQAYRYLGHNPEDFPVASRYQDEILSLPMFPELKEEQIRFVADKIMEF
ncbi:DegT/DnrJ/EryC1/StrS family aminotransferase, partial [bacterium]|nr:DegT/DnrJ/EryC1/StrS family aminotransferase [bacterium]